MKNVKKCLWLLFMHELCVDDHVSNTHKSYVIDKVCVSHTSLLTINFVTYYEFIKFKYKYVNG